MNQFQRITYLVIMLFSLMFVQSTVASDIDPQGCYLGDTPVFFSCWEYSYFDVCHAKVTIKADKYKIEWGCGMDGGCDISVLKNDELIALKHIPPMDVEEMIFRCGE